MRFTKKKILITDDSHGFLLFMSVVLTRMGFSVIPAEDGTEAVKLINLRLPDLVFLDVHMPGLGGLDALRKLKSVEQTSNIPVIMVSADISPEVIRESKRLGCAGFLGKPINIVELHEILQENLIVPTGQMRRNLRLEYSGRVSVFAGTDEEELFARTISECGIYLMRKEPFPVGSELDVEIPFTGGSSIRLAGTVIYINTASTGPDSLPTGMAIEFRSLAQEEADALSGFVLSLLDKEHTE